MVFYKAKQAAKWIKKLLKINNAWVKGELISSEIIPGEYLKFVKDGKKDILIFEMNAENQMIGSYGTFRDVAGALKNLIDDGIKLYLVEERT